MSEAKVIAGLNTTLVQKAIAEPAFRAALLTDPKSAVESALNTKLPEGLNLKVVEATVNEFTIVLPYEPKVAADGELSDDDLESVAGGSKAGARQFFNDVGSYIEHNPVTVGSAVGGALGSVVGVGTAVSVGCKAATMATGQK